MTSTKVQYAFRSFSDAAEFARERAVVDDAPIRVYRRFDRRANPNGYHFAMAGVSGGTWCVRARPGLSVEPKTSPSDGRHCDADFFDDDYTDYEYSPAYADNVQGNLRSDWGANFDEADASDWEDWFDRQDE